MIKIVESYKTYFKNNSFENFIRNKNIEYEIFWFNEDKDSHAYFRNRKSIFLTKRQIFIRELINFFLVTFKIGSFRNKKIVCFGGQYSLMLFTKMFGVFLGRGYHLIIYNFYIHKLGEYKIVRHIISFLLSSKKISLIVQSPEEINYFSALSKNKVHFIPYCENPDEKINKLVDEEEGYLFTGGYTNRDYDLILECAKKNPKIKFMVVVSKLNKNINKMSLPDNVIMKEEVDYLTFKKLMYNSMAVIVPLKEDVGASGQMLCIGAMKMTKPIIYTNISSINYYFKENECGIPYEIGDVTSLNQAIEKLFSNDFDSKLMAKKAFTHYAENYTLNKRDEKLLEIIQQK